MVRGSEKGFYRVFDEESSRRRGEGELQSEESIWWVFFFKFYCYLTCYNPGWWLLLRWD